MKLELIDLGGSFTEAPKRTTSRSIPLTPTPAFKMGPSPTPPTFKTISLVSHGGFSHFGALPCPDFSSPTPNHNDSSHTGDFRPPRRIVFHFYGRMDKWKSNDIGIPNSPSV
ncbi:hypothetical protein AVEN_185896-1 [Araneus ventricosus]|uniref:Uncharacterized protein n=1 Tax=Araneus ventricosus TaxID=182803 RepID=A0A4Y2KL88_ARAVE|nr:hypothetical protein AVEN_185896-1 [Araneus ventricosus]